MKRIRLVAVALTVFILTGCAGNLERGVEALQEQKYEDAIVAFEAQIEKGEELGEAYRGIGIAQYELKQYEAAKQSFEQALEQGAKQTGSMCHILGTCCVELELWEEALSYYQLGIQMEDVEKLALKEMRFQIIGIQEKLGDWEAAKQSVTDYLEDYPDDEQAKKEAVFLETR